MMGNPHGSQHTEVIFKFTGLRNAFSYSYGIEVKTKWDMGEIVTVQGRCIRQLALTAAKNARFPSYQRREDQSIAENAIQSIDDTSRDS